MEGGYETVSKLLSGSSFINQNQPRVISNPDFKVTILFNVKSLENGTR